MQPLIRQGLRRATFPQGKAFFFALRPFAVFVARRSLFFTIISIRSEFYVFRRKELEALGREAAERLFLIVALEYNCRALANR